MEMYFKDNQEIQEWIELFIEKLFTVSLLSGNDADSEYYRGCETAKKIYDTLKEMADLPVEVLIDGIHQLVQQRLPDSRVIENFPNFNQLMNEMIRVGISDCLSTSTQIEDNLSQVDPLHQDNPSVTLQENSLTAVSSSIPSSKISLVGGYTSGTYPQECSSSISLRRHLWKTTEIEPEKVLFSDSLSNPIEIPENSVILAFSQNTVSNCIAEEASNSSTSYDEISRVTESIVDSLEEPSIYNPSPDVDHTTPEVPEEVVIEEPVEVALATLVIPDLNPMYYSIDNYTQNEFTSFRTTSIVANETPEEVVNEEPEEVVNEEPEEVVNEEPEEVVNEEAEVVVNEEPEVVVNEESEVVVNEEPVEVVNEEPEVAVNEEPEEVVNDESIEVSIEEPEEMVIEAPEVAVNEEPVEVVNETPVEVAFENQNEFASFKKTSIVNYTEINKKDPFRFNPNRSESLSVGTSNAKNSRSTLNSPSIDIAPSSKEFSPSEKPIAINSAQVPNGGERLAFILKNLYPNEKIHWNIRLARKAFYAQVGNLLVYVYETDDQEEDKVKKMKDELKKEGWVIFVCQKEDLLFSRRLERGIRLVASKKKH